MKYHRLLLVAVFFLANCSLVFTQSGPDHPSGRPLRNGDILRMHKAGVKPSAIIGKIVTSQCNFDTFPPVLRELRMKGVPDSVILAMVRVPYGPPAASLSASPSAELAPRTAKVEIPAGTLVEVESLSRVSSANVYEGGRINLRVSRRVLINGVLVIERGALARARVIKSKPAAAWGRAGTLNWALEEVVAVDGTIVPIKLSEHIKGNNRTAAVITAAIVTGAVVFPYSPPMGLIWGLKKGGEAVLDGNRISTATVGQDTEVSGILPVIKKLIYHSVDLLKAATTSNAAGLPPMSDSFRATPIRQH